MEISDLKRTTYISTTNMHESNKMELTTLLAIYGLLSIKSIEAEAHS